MSGFAARVLVVAKSPVAGLSKTRLATAVGDAQAAALAAAALLDSLDAVESVALGDTRILALSGDLRAAVDGDEIAARLTDWRVLTQRGTTFAERLVNAHHDVADTLGDDAPLVQIGTDTPQITGQDLADLAAAVDVASSRSGHVALGPATDGGWWGLATRAAGYVDALTQVPMSQSDTCDLTQAALESTGARVSRLHALTDVDTMDDAFRVAALAPSTRFAKLLGQIVHGAAR